MKLPTTKPPRCLLKAPASPIHFLSGPQSLFSWITAAINTLLLSFIVSFKATATMIKTSFTNFFFEVEFV
jgi:hypothetical protein